MAWLDIFLRFVADIVHYTAWPVVVIGTLYLFRKPLELKLKDLIRIGHKEFTAEFANLSRLQEEIKNKNVLDVTRENLNYENHLNLVEALTLIIAILASELRNYNEQSPLLDFAKHVVEQLATRIKAERPNSVWLKGMHTNLKRK